MLASDRGDLRERLSLALLVAGTLAIFGVGAAQLAKDGSLWRDEASVAISLLDLSTLELLGRLEGGQSFPRVYLVAIAGLKSLFGYHTPVLRALPFLFFALGAGCWTWLLHRRYRGEPALLAVGVLLTLIPATWFVQAAMLKPYTFDVFAALVPFVVSDAFYASTLERGERPWRMLLLTAFGAASYPFALALAARLAGWWIAGLARGRRALDPTGAAITFGSMTLFGAGLWLTDLRHTSELSAPLGVFWQKCVIGSSAAGPLALLDRFAFGWYDGDADFSRGGGLPGAVLLALRLGFAAGVVRLALSMVRPDADATPGWGSRSLGCAALACGVVCASLVARYPLCPGRLTLFALPALQIVTLEGLSWVTFAAARLPAGRTASALVGLALVAAIAPTSVRDASRQVRSAAPDDLRPGLERIRARPELPLVATTCTAKQIATLPEGVDREVHYVAPGSDPVPGVRASEVFVLYAPTSFCRSQIQALRARSTSWTEEYRKRFASRLVRAELRGL